MTVTIDEILDWDALMRHVDDGEVSMRYHPEFEELAIFNYTEKAAFARLWTNETRMSRGLIVNLQTTEVLARPFAKFFNYGEPEAPLIDMDAEVYWQGNKEDGSLGIGYMRPDGRPAIATRGSFASEQAIHATNLVRENEILAGDIAFYTAINLTPVYEIIFPENRIVLDYGDRDELIKLGCIDVVSGAYLAPIGARPTQLTLKEILSLPPRDNAEGWVVWIDPHTAVKIKYEAYVELHRIVTGLNRKSVWRALRDGTYKELLEKLPDELVDWAEEVAVEIYAQHAFISEAAMTAYVACGATAGSQKDFALTVQKEVTDTRIRGLVFSLRAGKNISDAIYKIIEPQGGDR